MADSSLTLSTIPYHCQREILRHLEVQAVRILRLTSRQMKNPCSGSVSNGFLRRQTMDNSKESLISLRLIACYEEFRGVVQELRVRVPLYRTACVIRMMFMQQRVTPEDHNFVASPAVTQDKFFEASALKVLTSALEQLGSLEMIDLDHRCWTEN